MFREGKFDLVELVTWHTANLEEAAVKLFGYIIKSDMPLDKNRCLAFVGNKLIPTIRRELGRRIVFNADSYQLVYQGPTYEGVIFLGENSALWKTTEPVMVVEDNTFSILSPSFRNKFYNTFKDIGLDMQSVYKLRFSPHLMKLSFPIEEYSRSREVVAGLVIKDQFKSEALSFLPN